MAKKKRSKTRRQPVVPVADLIKLAEERLQQGKLDEAAKMLMRAEAEIRRASGGGKASSLPPHLAAAQPLIAPLLAEVFFRSALQASDPREKISHIEEALKRAPSDSRYLLALGACRLTIGKPEEALELFQQARQASPGDEVADQAIVLALLAANRTREVKERTKASDEAKPNPHLNRLGMIRDLMVGNFTQVGAGIEAEGAKRSPSAGDSSRLHENRLVNNLMLLASGDVERAKEALKELPALDRNPSRGEAAVLSTQLFYIGALSFQMGRFKEAAGNLGEACRLARRHGVHLPWMERAASYYHRVAEAAVAEGDMELGVECWRRALELDSGDKAAAANLEAARRVKANEAWQAGQVERALELWKEALEIRPHDEQALKNAAVACEKLGRKEEAATYWRTIAQRWRQQIKSRSSDEQFKKRLLLLEQHLVKIMIEADRPYYEILNELELALKIDPANNELRLKHAEMLLEIGSPQKALKHLEFIERKQGESPHLLLQKAMALEMAGRERLARKCIERAYEIAPSNPAVKRTYLIELGHDAGLAGRGGDYESAIETCLKQLSIDSTYMPALSHLASLYFKTNDEEKGKGCIARIISQNPDDAHYYRAAGGLYLGHGCKRESQEAFERAIELDSSDDCLIRIGEICLDIDEKKKAITYFNRAAKSGSLDALFEIARLLYEADETREAERFINKAEKIDPHHPEIHLARAAFLSDNKKIDEAFRELDEVERLAAGREKFEDILSQARGMRRTIEMRLEIRRRIEEGDIELPDLPGMPPELMRLLAEILEER